MPSVDRLGRGRRRLVPGGPAPGQGPGRDGVRAGGGEGGRELLGGEAGETGKVGQGDHAALGEDPRRQAGPAGGLAGLQLLGAADPGGGAADRDPWERVEDHAPADRLVAAAVPHDQRLEHVQDQRPLQVQPDQGVAAGADLDGVERLEPGRALGRPGVDQVGAAPA